MAVADICQGSGDEVICDNTGTLFSCSSAGLVEHMESCKSRRHCQLGRERRACAVCVPGMDDGFRCDGAMLSACAENGIDYTPVTTCETEVLCNPVAGACTNAACTAGQKICRDDMLLQCAADLTALEPVKQCDSGLCDAEIGDCDACVPDARTCDGNTAVVCSSDGSQLIQTPCPADRPVCVGDGRCAQCAGSGDCPDPGPCQERYCELASGVCEPRDSVARTACQSGVCDGQGGCLECLDAALDCPAVGDCQVPYCNASTGKCEPQSAMAGTACNGTGMCDATGQCDQCNPGDKMCSGTNTVLSCDAAGQGYTPVLCPAGTQCTRMGECVQCTTMTDCDWLTSDCKVGVCSGNTCGTQDRSGTCSDFLGRPGTCVAGTCRCAPQCSGKTCGSDGCGGSCGSCSLGKQCSANGTCQCVPQCSGKVCGSDGCGGTCGSCSSGEQCTANGACVCVPQCSGKNCGPDGCGGVCGNCNQNQTCNSGTCQCVPQCSGKQCGSNGCGGTCGSCRSSEQCFASQCVVPAFGVCAFTGDCGGSNAAGYTCMPIATASPMFCVPLANGTSCPSGTVNSGMYCLLACDRTGNNPCPSQLPVCHQAGFCTPGS